MLFRFAFGVLMSVIVRSITFEQRVGWQARLHKKHMPETQAGLIALSADAAGYLAGAARGFGRDNSGVC